MDSIKSAQIQNTLFDQLTDKNLERLRRNSEFGKGVSQKKWKKWHGILNRFLLINYSSP